MSSSGQTSNRRCDNILAMNTQAEFLPDPAARQRSRARTFCRAAFTLARHQAAGGGVDALGGVAPEAYARKHWENDLAAPRIVRSAVAPMDTSSAPLATSAASDFVGSLAPISGAARLIEASLRLQGAGSPSISVPWATDVTAVFVGQGSPYPVAQSVLADVDVSTITKIGVILTMTNALLAGSNGEAVFEALLRRAAAQALDKALFSDTAGSAACRPAGGRLTPDPPSPPPRHPHDRRAGLDATQYRHLAQTQRIA